MQNQLDHWFIRVTEAGRSAVSNLKQADSAGSDPHSKELAETVKGLTSELGQRPFGPDEKYPLDSWLSATAKCGAIADDALRWVYNLPKAKSDKHGIDPVHLARNSVFKLVDVLDEVTTQLSSTYWQMANVKAVLLKGPAGIGKSHLLADIVEFQVHAGYPALLVLGSTFVDNEPWRQILGQLDRPATEQIKHFLGCMDSAAHAAGVRALICIDALNERNGVDVWPHHLAAFLKLVESFPRIGVIVSCRSTYVPYVIPDELISEKLYLIEHDGFAADGGKAAKVYLDKRGIVRPGAPNLVPEFENPLFLKTCCDFLEKEGRNELPRGLRGVTSIFNFYNEAVSRALNQRMKLDPRFKIVPKAISGFAKQLADAGVGYLDISKALEFFESVKASGGDREQSLLSQLESEGVITIEPIRKEDGSIEELVRFSFERFSDHVIATRLFHDHLDKEDVAGSFKDGGALHDFVFGEGSYHHAGIIEAMAVQLPETTGVELLDVGKGDSWVVQQAFLESVLWREQSYFTDRTFEILRGILNSDELTRLLISVSTEPENKFNARYIHERLLPMAMPERDASWSCFIGKNGFYGPVEVLISWALNNGMEHIDEDRAYLSSTMLTWFFTTSNRLVRDKATKALACVLSRRLALAAKLLQDFKSINDVYVMERLLAACYGAVLQGDTSGLGVLSQTVFNVVFADGNPPVNVLLRDHAQGIIEYANWRGVLPDEIDVNAARPPYKSPWPIEHVSDEEIKGYTQGYERGIFSDAIVSSVVNDGDFARYQIDYAIRYWNPAPIGTNPRPTDAQICATWMTSILDGATPDQESALTEFIEAAKGAKSIARWEKCPENERVNVAETALKAVLSSGQWEEFRVSAQGYIRGQMFGGWRNDTPASFDSQWGRRWICKRAHELGWTENLFGDFEKFHCRGYDRNNHELERIGKKYQWIAFRELLARMADNLAFNGDSWEAEAVPTYKGAVQIGKRDIDPSLLTTGTHYDGWGEWGKTWWVPFDCRFRPQSPRERLAWLESDNDIINTDYMIDLRDPKAGRRWLALEGFARWTGSGVFRGSKELQRETWFRLNCLVVRSSDLSKIVDHLKDKILTDPHSMPKIELWSRDFYLGEFPWHPNFDAIDEWILPREGWWSFPVPARATIATYSCEKGGYDYSIDASISVEIPAPWLAGSMGVRLASGQSPVYVDSSDKVTFFDPSVVEPGPSAALVDRDAFLQALDREGLAAVWVIAGEKNVYGGSDLGMGFGGRLLHTAIYTLGTNGFTRNYYNEMSLPSIDQLERFLREDSDEG
ncbi:hypothetical protein [Trichloromonas acetexigens]|uniref:ATP-binding protein n=1 Tax=Trichloromonas acetexigens TaxID=38815 RepID=A0A550J3M4_9BACT|nr:hypothetical protein [Desulfuromonas acetexigens]TRO77809.1 hypothetical protein FL622_16965 [Desulfuromonas acetexigens]